MLPLKPEHELLLTEDPWAEIAIVSTVQIVSDAAEPPATITAAPGDKCARCWRVLPEVRPPAMLCERCEEAVEIWDTRAA